MASIPQVILRIWTFIWTLLALALVSNVIADAFSGNPSSVNFAEFVAVMSFVIILVGLVGLFIEIPALILSIVDGVAAIFSLIAGIVLSARLGVHSCGNQHYLVSNNVTNGSHNMRKRCHELQASTAFFYFMAVGFAGSAILSFTSSGSSGMGRRGIRKGPSMSQV